MDIKKPELILPNLTIVHRETAEEAVQYALCLIKGNPNYKMQPHSQTIYIIDRKTIETKYKITYDTEDTEIVDDARVGEMI